MKPTTTIFATLKPRLPQQAATSFEIPSLSSITVKDLPNSQFGKGTYFLSKSKFGHWPVYKKVQNTKITTEIKRVEGDVLQFKKDLIKLAKLSPKDVAANVTAGYVNVRGDKVEDIKAIFDEYLK